MRRNQAGQGRRTVQDVTSRTRTVDCPSAVAAIGYVVLAVWLIAPVAMVFGVVAARVVEPDDKFAAAMGTTTAVGVLGGLLAVAILRHRIGRTDPAGPDPSAAPAARPLRNR